MFTSDGVNHNCCAAAIVQPFAEILYAVVDLTKQ